MAKTRIFAVLILAVMLLAAMPYVSTQRSAEAAFAPTDQSVNLAPYDGATEIGPSFVFIASYPDPAPEECINRQMQFRTTDGSYDLPLFDSGIVSIGTAGVYPAGLLAYGETYYWRVRFQDELGYWTLWSAETSFTVIINSPPSMPQNFDPDAGAEGVSLAPTLEACEFRDPNAGELVLGERDTHAASQWQVTAASDNYTSPVFDGGAVTADLTSIAVPLGILSANTTYYWHVRYQDSYGNWSAYSQETSFTTGTTVASPVRQPVNVTPFDGAIEISPDQRLKASEFVGSGATHYASRWLLTSTSGAYGSPLFDSGIDTNNKVQIAVPVGLVDFGKTYYWRVKYQDDTGAWSLWSEETSYTVVENVPPSSPKNLEPLQGAINVSATPLLKATSFSDPDATAYVGLTDSFAGSRWQVTSTAGDYSSPKWDSGEIGPTTSVTVPKGNLLAGTTYYWRVRYQDSRGNWSGYSEQTSFTTKSISVPVASFTADKMDIVAGRDLVTFTDNSTPASEIDSWSWNFGDETTETWTYDTRPPNGRITHKYTDGGTYTVTLTVKNGARPEGVVQTVDIVVHATPVAGFTSTPAAPKAGKQITFTDTTSNPDDVASWEWQFDDGTTVTWTTRPANGQITHTFKKGGEHTVSLIVKGKGDLGESIYNKKINVKDAGGFQFGLWMVFVGVAVVVVVAGAVYLLRARKGAK